MWHVIDWFRCRYRRENIQLVVALSLLRLMQLQGETIMGNLATLQASVDALTLDAAAVKVAVEAGKFAVETKLDELTAQVIDLQVQLALGAPVSAETFDSLTAAVDAVSVTVKSIGVPTV